MKRQLSLVALSMSLLGYCSAFAATETTTETTTSTEATAPATTTTTETAAAPAKHKHHHHHHHVAHHHAHHDKMVRHEMAMHDYKDMGVLPAPVLEVCPRVDLSDQMLDMMGQNVGRAKPTVDCMKPISFSGGINFDSDWGSRNLGYNGVNSRRFSLNDAYLNVHGNVNEWVQAFMSIDYDQYTDASTVMDPQRSPNGSGNVGTYSAAYAPNGTLRLEQGTITLKNMQVMPIFVRVGREFTDFGRYQIHPMTETLAQSMTESLQTQAQVGFFTPMGFNGSIYTFNGPMTRNNGNGSYNSHATNNFGASLNFTHPDAMLGFNAGVGYMYDFTGVDQVNRSVGFYNGTGINGTYTKRVSAGTIYGDLNSGPFSVGVRFVGSFQRFSPADLASKGPFVLGANGAKPWGLDVTAGYGFNAAARDMNIYLGYQATQQAVNLFLPKNRWLAGYGVNVLKNTNLGVEFNHDNAYSASNGGSGRNTNRVNLRAGVMFG